MKKSFFDYMYILMGKNPDIFFLFGDLGWPRYDEFKEIFPKRVFNCGASEQTMLDMTVGLAYSGKIPFCYTITPFYYRGFETLRTYIDHEKLHVILVGAGRNDDYSKDHGFSHDAWDIKCFLVPLSNIKEYYPDTKEELPDLINKMIKNKEPAFLSLKR